MSNVSTEVKYQTEMRVISAVMLVFGLIELGVGASVWSFMSYEELDIPGMTIPEIPGFGGFNLEPGNDIAVEAVGGWWGVVLVIITACFGLVTNCKEIVVVGTVLSALAMCILALALIVDTYKTRNNFIFCADMSTLITTDDYYYTPPVDDVVNNLGFECICLDKWFYVYLYEMHRGFNCDDITTKYDDQLTTSCVMLFICAFLLVAYHTLCWWSMLYNDTVPTNDHGSDHATASGRDKDNREGMEMVAPAAEPVYGGQNEKV